MIPNDGDRKEMGMYMALAQCGMEMVAPMILGIFLDSRLGTMPWITIISVVLGFVGGLTHMVLMSNKIAEYEARKKKGKTKMKKYVLTLTAEALDSTATLEAVKQAVAAQGARNIEIHGMGLMTVDSEVPLNFAAISGVENSQEVKEVGQYQYIVTLTDDANPQAVQDAIAALGARNIVLHDAVGTLVVDSEVPINFAGIAGVHAAEPSVESGTQ
jgi:hypothetical protein